MIYAEYLNLLIDNNFPKFLNKYLKIPSLIRLKKIGYFCGMDYASKKVYNFKEKITRYDHSLTVALLTWKFTKDKKATIAGLFHDIGTPCFSHVIDYMNKDYEKQESTEIFTEEIIKNDKELLKIFKEDNILPEDIINFKKYTVVDTNRPKLCADRIDGIILNGYAWIKSLTKNDIFEIVNDLAIYKNEENEDELGFKTEKIALKVLNTSKEIDKFSHSNEDNFMMELLARITKTAIDNKLIKYKDLYYLDEEILFNKIKNSKINELNELVYKFENIDNIEIPSTILENVKERKLNPIVNGKRIKEKLKMNLRDFTLAPFYTIDQEWAVLTAGTKEKFNSMTISWGGMGTIWNKPVLTVYVKKNRYTYEFMENNEYFTVSFFDEKYKKDLSILGTKSGRNTNKISMTNLTFEVLKDSITFKEAKLTILCKKIYFQDLEVKNINNKSVIQSEIDRFYKNEPIHRMYIGEVIDIIDKRDS